MCDHRETQSDGRRSFLKATIAASAAAAGVASGAAGARGQEQPEAESIIENWPETAKKAAKAMIEKYGQPDEKTASLLIWRDNGPWKRTMVNKEEIDHDFPMPHKDVLEQFINYDVPPDKFDELAKYDGSVIAERTKGELSARCDKEGANFLALNLAHEIVQGERSVEEARQFYADTIKASMEGEESEYMQGLIFDPPAQAEARDPDEAIIQGG